MKLAVVEMGNRVMRSGLEHAIELLPSERKASGLGVERGVLADEHAQPFLEAVRGLDQVLSLGFLFVVLEQQLLDRIVTLLQSRRVAEEERLGGAAAGRLVAKELEELQRFFGIVPGADDGGDSGDVGITLEITAVAVDGRNRTDLEPESQDGVGRPAQHRRA